MQRQARWPQQRRRAASTSSISRPAFRVQQRRLRAPQRAKCAAPAALPTTAENGVAQQPFWSCCVSRRINLELAVEEAVAGALREAPQQQPELAIVFVSSAYTAEYSSVVEQLRAAVPSLTYIVGSSVRRWRAHARAFALLLLLPAATAASGRGHTHCLPLAACNPLPQGYGVIGSTDEGPEEIEHAPALSITLACLPGVQLSITHVTPDALPDGGACVALERQLLHACRRTACS